MQILDKITLNCGNAISGIIDFSCTKHLIVVDLTNNASPSLTKRLIEWRLYYPNLRFTVYASMFGVSHPLPILINKKNIVNSTLANPTQKIKKTERVILPS